MISISPSEKQFSPALVLVDKPKQVFSPSVFLCEAIDFPKRVDRVLNPYSGHSWLHAHGYEYMEALKKEDKTHRAKEFIAADQEAHTYLQKLKGMSSKERNQFIREETDMGRSLLLKLISKKMNSDHSEKTDIKNFHHQNRLRALVHGNEADDIFIVLSIVVDSLRTSEWGTEFTLSNEKKLLLLASAVAYAQERVTLLLKEEAEAEIQALEHHPKKKEELEKRLKNQRKTARDQVLIYVLSQVQLHDPELVHYLLALHHHKVA